MESELREEDAPQHVGFSKGWETLKREGVDVCLRRLDYGVDIRRGQNGQPGRALQANEVSKLYALAYKMCTQATPHNWSGKLYYAILDELRAICEERTAQRLARARDDALLNAFIDEWDKHEVLIRSFRAFLGYLDRFYVKRLALLTLEGAAVKAFHDFVFESIKSRITREFLNEVDADRKAPAGIGAARVERLRRVRDICIALGQGSIDDYEREIEAPLVQETVIYMKEISQRWMASTNCPEYLHKVRAQLEEEDHRIESYLHVETRDKLLHACEHELISVHLENLVNKPGSGCSWMLRNGRDDDLQLMFQLLKKVPGGLTPMAFTFRKFLQEIGADMLAKPQYRNQWENRLDQTLIFRLVNLNVKYRALVKTRFAEHNTFHRALKEAFEFFINLPLPMEEEKPEDGTDEEEAGSDNDCGGGDDDDKDEEEEEKGRAEGGNCGSEANAESKMDGSKNAKASRRRERERRRRKRQWRRHEQITISELLSDYLDRKLRKSPMQMAPISPIPTAEGFLTPRTETLLERELAVTVELFGYVNEKDVFALFYRKHLAKRLILNRTTSHDAERVVIAKLQKLCGVPFVSKFTGMLKDLMLADGLQRDFERYMREKEKEVDFDFNVKVLTSGFWPTYRHEAMTQLPHQLSPALLAFESFYGSRTAHRTLTWIHALGTMTLSGRFTACEKPVQLVVTTFQGAILLLYNESDTPLSVTQMASRLGLSVEITRKQLHSLTNGKHAILRSVGASTASGENEALYGINDEFTTRARRIRIPQLPMEKAEQAKQERSTNLLKISEERRYAVEAAIVRILKTHKTLSYVELSVKVVEMLSPVFMPQPNTIRKRVDDLLERDYIEKDEADDSKLVYVA
ncbi:Cullin-1 [Hondaea fermentalgiana]|uniref:Cullin-1 n=1 Tax=Hondaea fermentalgiana TaxID=2315210 RepID=A0A2R5GPH7_9STRA|nr:Cullin-1 [Hondaea fermentalgiana]|eukprot:GBG32209.1 Cullin-1 [Hondaea fermentalgiana]